MLSGFYDWKIRKKESTRNIQFYPLLLHFYPEIKKTQKITV